MNIYSLCQRLQPYNYHELLRRTRRKAQFTNVELVPGNGHRFRDKYYFNGGGRVRTLLSFQGTHSRLAEMNRAVENKAPPPQYRKIQQENVSTVSVQSGSATSDHSRRKKTTVLQKVGVWNAAIILIGSLCILGVLGFLWYLASLFAIHS